MNIVRASIMLGIAGCSYGLNLTVMKLANMAGYFREDLMVAQYLFAAILLGIVVANWEGVTELMRRRRAAKEPTS